MRIVYCVLLASTLGACASSTTSSLYGTTEDGAEKFSGSTTTSVSGVGTLTIASEAGLSCSGRFVYVLHRLAKGTLNCANGQSGSFELISAGGRGTGSGTFGSRRFTFDFGSSEERPQSSMRSSGVYFSWVV
jgi:hypothetical protein